MSVDTVTTCTTAQRHCRTRGKVRKNKSKRDSTPYLELSPNVSTPQIHIDEDLGFDLLEVSDIPEDMLFPGEYNVYLQDKVKSVCEENKHLCTVLKEREAEMTIIKNKLQTLEEQSSSCQGLPYLMNQDSIRHADMAACRVMELTKQVCELTAKLEEQKGRCALAETKLLSVMECQEERQPVPIETLTRKEAEIKTLSDKIHVTNSKLFEARNKILHLQQEMKSVHKILLCEVGDGMSISEILSSGGAGGWRGRAQQIQILQQRVTELTERLRKCCDYRNLESAHTYCGDGKCTSKERKASLEVAQQDTRIAQQKLNESIRKLDAAKARIKVLESESNSCRVRLQLLTDKGSRDDDFIQTLQAQISQLESALQFSKEDARLELKKSEKCYQQLLDDQRIEKQRSLQLLSSLEDKEKKIKRLEDVLFEMKDKEINSTKLENEVPPVILCAPVVS
ncbi:hypothetical protein ONE63_008420 [Megalurothrips usitatus]|uniref:Coiled-coil domain-containing protein 13-like n=1 Tax=Megalurothrips usitatus TaxID=439358 RepID=A0AAV7XPP3_9NEOP|nr:hypothetical protein ONE63_008420 [Megalurothrips usitatus]